MSRVAIITDTNSGMTVEEAKRCGAFLIPMPFNISGKTFYEGTTLSFDEFYEKQTSGESISTSQPSPSEVMKVWDEALASHDEAVYIPMSSGLSGSYQTAFLLSQEEQYDGRVFVANNQRISVTQKRSVLDALDFAAKGRSGKEICDYLESVKMESSIYIMLDTLTYLMKGGRITPAAAALGNLLRLKPVLQIQGEKLDAFAKARTTSQGISIMINAMKKDITERFGKSADNVWLYIAHTRNEEGANALKEEILAMHPDLSIEISELPLSIGCHIGPGSLAIACSRKEAF